MTWRQLEREIYNIIFNGDELLDDQGIVDLIMEAFDKFENGGK